MLVLYNKATMGIPTFFRSILRRDNSVIMGATKTLLPIDYFFLDFNSMIYNAWHELCKNTTFHSEREAKRQLIERVIYKTRGMIKEIVCPTGYTYISIDGTAPRAKMVQQRSRRYKSLQLSQYLGKKVFDPSANIAPGTVFMSELTHALKQMMSRGDCGRVYLNDSSIAGEGEHKFLPRIRRMASLPEESDKTIVIFSPDGDMISLSLLTHKKNIFLMRVPDPKSEAERIFSENHDYIYCDLNKVRTIFFEDLVKTYSNVDEMRILNDYNFLLSMVGNDFVPSLHFLKIRSGGMKLLIDIYNEIRNRQDGYLVYPCNTINLSFFKEIMWQLSCRENEEMRRTQSMLQREQNGQVSQQRRHDELSMSAQEIYASRLQHVPLCNPDNPLYPSYHKEFSCISYFKPKHEWKSEYYRYFTGIDYSNITEYNRLRTMMVHNYLESLMFTLCYYNTGCPSWSWHYRYRVAPLPSDVYTVLDQHEFNPNHIVFTKDSPFTPFQQLMFILPPQMSHLLPKPIAQLMHQHPEYYPTEFRVDAVAGIKYIYSEAILPDIDTQDLLPKIKHVEKSVSTSRNILRKKLWSNRNS